MPMPKQQPATSRQDYSTPKVFIDAVKSYLGVEEFVYDFAASADNRKAERWCDDSYGGAFAMHRWADFTIDGWGWLNPPYKDITPWAAKCLQTAKDGGRIAFLVPASVGSNWYRDYIHNQFSVKTLFLNGRIPFIPDKPNWLYPKDCILVLFGTDYPYCSDVWTWRDECPKVSSVGTRKQRKNRSNGLSAQAGAKLGRSKRHSG